MLYDLAYCFGNLINLTIFCLLPKMCTFYTDYYTSFDINYIFFVTSIFFKESRFNTQWLVIKFSKLNGNFTTVFQFRDDLFILENIRIDSELSNKCI